MRSSGKGQENKGLVARTRISPYKTMIALVNESSTECEGLLSCYVF